MSEVQNSPNFHSFATHKKEHIKPNDGSHLPKTEKEAIALNQMLTTALKDVSNIEGKEPTHSGNLYSHMREFYAAVSKTFADLKRDNNDQKREDKAEVEDRQRAKGKLAWTQCALEMGFGLFGGILASTGETPRAVAEMGIGKVSQGINSVITDKSQKEEHGIQVGDRKQEAAKDRNRSIGDNDRTVREALSNAMRNYDRSYGDGKINS
ncbi:MAG: hypothetical protein H7A39_05510 [Chlamydiales bacterium]|nr:hypothetical protein [Chlamydiales bacterium]